MHALLVTAALAVATPDFGAALERLRLGQDVPGAAAVVTRGADVIYAGGSGVADLETGRPVTADTVFYAGSLTKVLTAVLVLSLVEDGRLSLDQPVADLRGKSIAPVRVDQLLTHTSGLPREGNFGYWFSGDFPDAAALERHLEAVELNAEPGRRRDYSNIGYAVLGRVIEQTTGRPYGVALAARILEPLGMTDTGTNAPAPGAATGYTPTDHLLPSDARPFAGVGRPVGDRYVREYHDAGAMTPAFGAWTSAHDLGRLLRFLLGHGGGDVLSPGMRARMHEGWARGRGRGLLVADAAGRRVARHSGWFAAHRAHLLLEPASGIGVAVLANGDAAAPDAIAEALLALALH